MTGKVTDPRPERRVICAALLARSSGPWRGSGLGTGGLGRAQGSTRGPGEEALQPSYRVRTEKPLPETDSQPCSHRPSPPCVLMTAQHFSFTQSCFSRGSQVAKRDRLTQE